MGEIKLSREFVLKELEKAVDITPVKPMKATIAFHQMGEISSDVEDWVLVDRETPDYYIGSWITGYGYVGVLFPKSTTRELTPDEQSELETKWKRKDFRII